MLSDNGLKIDFLEAVGDYYSWMAVELARSMKNHSLLAALALTPAFIWYFFKSPTTASKNTLCMGYHVVATKLVRI